MKENSPYFHNRLGEGLGRLAIDLDTAAIERLYHYYLELKKWSAKVNLIARNSSDEQIIENHFLDSLTMLELLQGPDKHLLDVGTGAGFPGLVLKAVLPDLKLTLVEPRLKRVSFLKQVVRSLGLTGVHVLACRIEDEGQLPSECNYTHITSRAVTDVAGFLGMVARFTAPGLEIICMKGPKWQEELHGAAAVIAELHYEQGPVITKLLPFSQAERTLLIFNTISSV